MRSLLFLFLFGICYAEKQKRDTHDTVWIANGWKDAQREEVSHQYDRYILHEMEQCSNLVSITGYPFVCFQGQHVSSPETRAMYQCDFGNRRGRLFIHSARNNGDACIYDFTTQTFTGVVNFTLPGLVTYQGGNKFGSSFYAWHDRIYRRRDDCLVMGFACLLDNAVHANDI